MEYEVELVATINRRVTVSIEAESPEEAIDIAENKDQNGDISWDKTDEDCIEISYKTAYILVVIC